MAAEFYKSLEAIKNKHDEAFKIIDQAIRNEEDEHPLQALENYKKGIEIIDNALRTPIGIPNDVQAIQDDWNCACKMIQKLKRARAEVLQRVGVLSEKHKNAVQVDNVTIESHRVEGRARTYSELAEELKRMQCTGQVIDGLELLFSCSGAKLYRITNNGVTTTSEKSLLRIVRLEKNEEKHLNATYFIQMIDSSKAIRIQNVENGTNNNELPGAAACEQVDYGNDKSWIYPLVPGVSPCLRTEYGAFIFPDVNSTEPNVALGIIVPIEDGADEIVLEILESILHGVVTQTIEDREILQRPRRDTSTTISKNIVKGAYFVSQGLIKGAEKTGEFISYTTPYFISKIRGAAPDVPPVSNGVHTSVQIAKNVTGAAAGITGYVANKVGSATMALGRYLAPHIQKHGSTMLSKGFGLSETEAQEKVSGVLTIAAGAVEGFGTVYSGLETSATILGKNLSNNSVKIIEHKYGPSAGNLAAETFDTVGNVINLSQNVNYITPRGVVKRTAKNAGKAIVEGYAPTNQDENQADFLYPDLSEFEDKVKNKPADL